MGEYVGMVDIGWTMLFSVINFVILFLILRWKLYKPVNDFLKKREETIHNSIEGASEEKQEAERLRQEYQAALAQARQEAQSIIDRARQQGERVKEEMLNQARQDASRLIDRAKEEIQAEQQKALQQLRQEVATLAILSAERLLAERMDTATNRKLVADFIAKVGDN